MNPNRLIYISNARLPTEKAHGYQIIKMCEAFAKNDKAVELLHPARKQPPALKDCGDVFSYYCVPPNFKMTRLPCLDTIWFDDKLPYPLSRLLPLSKIQGLTYSYFSTRYLRKYFLDPQCIFLSRDPYTIRLLSGQRTWFQPKLIYEIHTFPQPRWQESKIRTIRNVDKLIVTTQHLKQMYENAGVPENKILVAPDGVDLEQFNITESRKEAQRKLGLPTDRPIIGYIGRFQTMEMEKGIPELIEALPLVGKIQGIPPLLLCVGGPMSPVPSYLKIAEKLKIPQEQMLFIDKRPIHEVPRWIRACDVCTIPWRWNNFSAYYTSPLKLFEYMAVGSAIVASDLPSLREILVNEQNAILVPPGSPRELANGLKRVLTNSHLAGNISRQAQQDVQKHTWENRAKEILEFIQN